MNIWSVLRSSAPATAAASSGELSVGRRGPNSHSKSDCAHTHTHTHGHVRMHALTRTPARVYTHTRARAPALCADRAGPIPEPYQRPSVGRNPHGFCVLQRSACVAALVCVCGTRGMCSSVCACECVCACVRASARGCLGVRAMRAYGQSRTCERGSVPAGVGATCRTNGRACARMNAHMRARCAGAAVRVVRARRPAFN